MNDASITVIAGKHLRFMRRGKWEYVERAGVGGAVGILAVTEERKLILVEQYRPPVDARVIELPAGLVGDEPGKEGEGVLVAARRELREETGYDAAHFAMLASGPSSPGMNSELITLVSASKLQKIDAGGGIEGESIVVHEVQLGEVENQLRKWTAEGKMVDLKVYAALYFLNRLP